jgi:prophage maintenance system killer protein
MNVFLILNGFEVEAPEPDVVATMLGVADGRLEEEALAEWLRRVVVPFAP